MCRFVCVLIVLALASAAVGQGTDVSEDALAYEIYELRLQARYTEAAELAKELLALRRVGGQAKLHEIVDAEGLVETLEYASGLSEEDRRELASADSQKAIYEAFYYGGRFADGAAAARKQLEIRRRLLGTTHTDVAESLNDLGVLLQLLGRYAEAEPIFVEALAMRRELLGDEHPLVAQSLNCLGDLLRTRGDYTHAGTLLRDALRMRQRLLGDEHSDVAESLNNLAIFFKDQGDYANAEPPLRKALATMRTLLGNENMSVTKILSNLATVLWSQGDYAGAELLFREALVMIRKLLGEEQPDVAVSLNNLAVLLQARGDYAGAEPLYRESLEMRRRLLGGEHPYVAQSLSNLGDLLRARGDYASAEQLLREALEMRRKLLGDDHPDVADSLERLALLLHARGDYAAAEPLYRESLATLRGSFGNYHPRVVDCLSDLAASLRALGDGDGAEELLTEAARVHDAARLRAGTGLARATFQRSPYPHLAAVRLALGRQDEAWPAAEKALARSLVDLLTSAEERNLSPTEAAAEDSLKTLLAELEPELAAYKEAARNDTTSAAARRLEATRNALLVAEANWSALEREIAAKHPVTEGVAFSLERVQSVLPEQTAIIGWLDVTSTENSYESWVYVIRGSGAVTWARADPPSGAGDTRSPHARVRSLRNDFADPSSSSLGAALGAHELWSGRIGPLVSSLADVQELIVIPSGAMVGVPIEALVDDEGMFVGDRYALSYVPSATVHTWLAARPRHDTAKRILLVGDPPYNRVQLASMEREEDVSSAATVLLPLPDVLRSALAGEERALESLPRLCGTRDEVVSVAGVVGACSLLLGPAASEQEMVRLAASGELEEFGTIHIATHAIVDDVRPERSALVLSQIDLPDPFEAAMAGTRIYDGLVTAREIVREWRLDADLVTLSACGTGLGKEVGGEGYIGFAHAFLQAGARSLVVSLWKVEDRATSLLMRRFYENRFGAYEGERSGHAGTPMSKARALQEAKQWLRDYTDDLGRRPYEHPYFWSAFVLIGDRK